MVGEGALQARGGLALEALHRFHLLPKVAGEGERKELRGDELMDGDGAATGDLRRERV
jgi:hypothetical protein